MESEEYKEMRAKALAQLRSGESFTGKNGAFAPLIKEFIETAFGAGLEHCHLPV